MEIIREYLDNMFAAYQSTPKTEKLKMDLLATMEDKYLELKAAGNSENSAVGTVVAEFGNIEELVVEYGISPASVATEATRFPQLSGETADAFLAASRKKALCFATAPFFAIAGMMVLFLVLTFASSNIPGYVSAIVGAAGTIGMFLYGSTLTNQYIQVNRPFHLLMQIRMNVEANEQHFLKSKSKLTTIGIVVLFITPIWSFIGMMMRTVPRLLIFSSILMLATIAGGCALLIYTNMVQRSYNKLLRQRFSQNGGEK